MITVNYLISYVELTFKAYGTSVGIDVNLGSGLILRGKVDHLFSPNMVFLG
jgi:hypothetical protein